MMTVGKLVEYLKTQKEKGVSHVYLEMEARKAIIGAIKREEAQTKPSPAVDPPSRNAPPNRVPSPPRQTRVPRTSEKRASPPAAPIVSAESIPLKLPDGSKEQQIQYLSAQAKNWPPATSLQSLRQKMIFSVGTPDTGLVLIGEAPGFEDELKSEPFVGRAGQKLNQILKAMGLNRTSLYITNICKFRPSLPGQTTNNRKPTAQEMAACMPLLKKELEVIKPKCIIALGAAAAEGLTGIANEPVGKLRGTWHEFEGIPVRVTYHPSYLLRNEDNIKEKRKLWEDMLSVMERLELPISEKQKGFFKS